MDATKFQPPGPGSWELEQTHLQRPVTRWMASAFPANMMRGFKETTAKYGMLLDHLEIALVEGFAYGCPRPVGAPKGAKGPPPKLVFKLLGKLHPEIRRRNRRAAETFATRRWRADVEQWHAEWKPQTIAANRELAAVDPRELDDQALAKHLDAVHARVCDAVYRHHALNGCAMVAVGDFLTHAQAWTGKSPRELLALLRGSSPVSMGAVAELERVGAAVRGDAAASTALAASKPAAALLDELRAMPGEVGTATRAYLDEVGLRMVSGYDVGDRYALEVPETLVAAVRQAVAGTSRAGATTVDADTAGIREHVPEASRAEFDALLGEARFVYAIRDERAYYNDMWANGIARRALLAAGERLVARGVLDAADHAVELSPEELQALLAGKPGPSRADVAARFAYRATHTVADAPAHLGITSAGPPPADWLPPAPARMMRAVGAMLAAMFDVAQPSKDRTTVRGLAASPGVYEGRARVVTGPEQFSRIERGDVLVARNTCPSYNVLLPLLGAVVTDRGGVLSHAAIVAREYGIPAVVGTTDATRLIPDAARVRIDGATGEVQVL